MNYTIKKYDEGDMLKGKKGRYALNKCFLIYLLG